jgi:hypothetical protein
MLTMAPPAPAASAPHSHSCACGMGCKTACCCAPKSPEEPDEPTPDDPDPADEATPARSQGCASFCSCGPQPDVPTPPGNEHRRLPENLLGALPLLLPAASGKAIPFPASPLSGRLPDSPASQPPEPVRAR